MFKILLPATAAVASFLAAGYGTPVRAQAAAVVAVDSPWKLVTKATLPHAIAAFEAYSGGRVLEVRFGAHGDVPGFDAVIAKAGAFSHLRVDIPANVVAVIAEADVPAWMASWILKADAKSLEKAKLHLVEAVVKAETMKDTPAVDAGIAAPLSGENDVLAYNIELIKNNQPERVVIDAVTGLKIANPDSLLEDWAPEKALHESLKKAR
jgi:hypothetical protein